MPAQCQVTRHNVTGGHTVAGMGETKLNDLTQAAAEVDALRKKLDDASRRRAELVLAHYDAGIPPTQIARAAGITRAYVYQLKDARNNAA